MDSNIYFPLTDGHLGYNIPVNLLKCQQTDGAEIYKVFSKVVMFTTIDDAWREHLREMDDLRQSVQNATYEQKRSEERRGGKECRSRWSPYH